MRAPRRRIHIVVVVVVVVVVRQRQGRRCTTAGTTAAQRWTVGGGLFFLVLLVVVVLVVAVLVVAVLVIVRVAFLVAALLLLLLFAPNAIVVLQFSRQIVLVHDAHGSQISYGDVSQSPRMHISKQRHRIRHRNHVVDPIRVDFHDQMQIRHTPVFPVLQTHDQEISDIEKKG